MTKGTVFTTASPTHLARGSVITCAGASGPARNYYIIAQKSPTELVIAATWRDSLWVPWFIVTGWLSGLWSPVRRWFLDQWDRRFHPEEEIVQGSD
jgi:hypothetical protein